MFTFPASDLDSAPGLLSSLGQFWSQIYSGNFLVECLLYARGRVEQQAHDDFLDLLASTSRAKIPVFHTDDWYDLTLFESQLNQADANFILLDGSYLLDGSFNWGDTRPTAYYVWQLPPEIVNVLIVTNRINTPNLAYINGVDFFVRDGAIFFRTNPFADPQQRVAITEVLQDGVQVDRTCSLWLYRSTWDHDNVYTQFGYVIDEKLPSSPQYKELVRANLDGLASGTTNDVIYRAFSAVCDVPLANGNETVQHIFTDSRATWVVTDQAAYPFVIGSTVLVSVGQSLHRGDSLTDALQFFEFGRGQVPDPSQIRALTVNRGFLGEGYFHDLVFENKEVPLFVDSDQTFTDARFHVGGFPGDANQFWTEVYDRGVAQGKTFAMCLDTRAPADRIDQPTAVDLPTTVNPLGLLLNNVFRANLFVALVKPQWFGPGALGLQHCRFLRRLIPPHSACIVMAELGYKDVIPMNGPGDDITPGYEEKFSLFVGNRFNDTITPDMVSERVRFYQISGRCQ